MGHSEALINFRRNTIIKNCFFFWSHFLILLLTGLSAVLLKLERIHKAEYKVPKTYELKMYAVAMLLCFSIPFLSRYTSSLFQTDHRRYQRYLLIFYPLAAMLYSFPHNELTRCLSVFILSLIGLGIFFYDVLYSQPISQSILREDSNYYRFLIASIVLAIFFVICKTDNHFFSFLSYGALVIFMVSYSILNLKPNKYLKYLLFLLVPIFLFAATFLSSSGTSIVHYGYFLGPVIEVIYGHHHPLELNAQYGSGLTSFLALYFQLKSAISIEGLRELLKMLAFTQYMLIFFIAAALFRSYKIAFLTLIAVLFLNFFSQINKYYECPSIGFLRFGLIYLIVLAYVLEGKYFSQKATSYIVSILGSLACIWSFESAIYTLPALFFAEYINKNLKKFLPIFLGCFIVIVFAYLSPFILQGQRPLLERFYEYAMLYSGGFGQEPLNRWASFWFFFPLLYGFFLIRIVTGHITNKAIVALTIYGIALFTYFGGRSADNNLFHVSIPFVLLSIYLILNLESPSAVFKKILLALAITVFLSINYMWPKENIGKMVLKKIWKINYPLVVNHFLPEAKQLKTAWSPIYPDQIIKTDCSAYSPLNKYIENNSIALLSEDIHLYLFYACTHVHNALDVNPYNEVSINPKAIERTVKKTIVMPNHYLLVDKNLLEHSDISGSQMTAKILKSRAFTQVSEFKLADSTIIVFSVG